MADRLDMATLVLAGGDGRRIGGAKPQRVLAGLTLLDRALMAAHGHGGPVALGVRKKGDTRAHADVNEVEDAAGIAGPLGGLAAGLSWAAQAGAGCLLTIPCDAPFLPQDLVARLRWRMQEDGCAAVIPASRGRLHPACGLWRVEARKDIQRYLDGGGRSLSGFATLIGHAVEDWGEATPDPFFNVNTLEDLRSAEEWLAQPHFE